MSSHAALNLIKRRYIANRPCPEVQGQDYKYERVYLQAYEAVSAARSDLDTYTDWYNHERVHSRIEDRTPKQAYWALLPELAVAA